MAVAVVASCSYAPPVCTLNLMRMNIEKTYIMVIRRPTIVVPWLPLSSSSLSQYTSMCSGPFPHPIVLCLCRPVSFYAARSDFAVIIHAVRSCTYCRLHPTPTLLHSVKCNTRRPCCVEPVTCRSVIAMCIPAYK